MPFSPLFLGRVPHRKKVGTLILTSLLEDLDAVTFLATDSDLPHLAFGLLLVFWLGFR